MSLVEFRYTKYRDMMVPMIPVRLKGLDRWFEFWAFVDSGATYSIFASREAEGLGIEMRQGEKRMVVVGDGSYIPVYLFKIPVNIVDTEFTAEIGFSDRLGVGFNLLGRKAFFEVFRVCFSDSEGRITLEKL